MRVLNEDQMYQYSAVFTAPCGASVFVWRDKDHNRQDQMRDHLKECKECHKIISNYKSTKDAGVLSSYVEEYIKNTQ